MTKGARAFRDLARRGEGGAGLEGGGPPAAAEHPGAGLCPSLLDGRRRGAASGRASAPAGCGVHGGAGSEATGSPP